jgi:hypothetical protein
MLKVKQVLPATEIQSYISGLPQPNVKANYGHNCARLCSTVSMVSRVLICIPKLLHCPEMPGCDYAQTQCITSYTARNLKLAQYHDVMQRTQNKRRYSTPELYVVLTVHHELCV